jgi:hypothetical protein
MLPLWAFLALASGASFVCLAAVIAAVDLHRLPPAQEDTLATGVLTALGFAFVVFMLSLAMLVWSERTPAAAPAVVEVVCDHPTFAESDFAVTSAVCALGTIDGPKVIVSILD